MIKINNENLNMNKDTLNLRLWVIVLVIEIAILIASVMYIESQKDLLDSVNNDLSENNGTCKNGQCSYTICYKNGEKIDCKEVIENVTGLIP